MLQYEDLRSEKKRERVIKDLSKYAKRTRTKDL